MGGRASRPKQHEHRLPPWGFACQGLCYLLALSRTLAGHLQVLLSILIGPAAARPGGQCSGAGGYADILNLQTLTVPSLAFGAVIVGPCSTFPYDVFSFVFHRRGSHCLRNQSAYGHQKAVHQDSTTWHSISESSLPLELGRMRNSDRFSCGGTGTPLPDLPSPPFPNHVSDDDLVAWFSRIFVGVLTRPSSMTLRCQVLQPR